MHNAGTKIRNGDLAPTVSCSETWAMPKPSRGSPMLNERNKIGIGYPTFGVSGVLHGQLTTRPFPSTASATLIQEMIISSGNLTLAILGAQAWAMTT